MVLGVVRRAMRSRHSEYSNVMLDRCAMHTGSPVETDTKEYL